MSLMHLYRRLRFLALLLSLSVCHCLLPGCRRNDAAVTSGGVHRSVPKAPELTDPESQVITEGSKSAAMSSEVEAEAVDKAMRRHFGLRVARDEDRRARAIAMRPGVNVRAVLRDLPVLRHVEEVDISGTPLREEDLVRLVDSCPNIRVLDLLDCSLDSSWAIPPLRRLKRLECLSITEDDQEGRRAWNAVFGDIMSYNGEVPDPKCSWQWRYGLTLDPDAPGRRRGSLP